MNPPNVSLLLIMVCFWVTFWLIRRFLIAPVGRVLDERHGRIDGADALWASKHEDYLATAARVESELEAAAREAGRLRAERRQQAQAQRQQALDEARTTAEDRLEAALSELDLDLRSARAELDRHAADLSRQFATRLLGREVKS
jgi:F-type H+-transporting ATPase subunit b